MNELLINQYKEATHIINKDEIDNNFSLWLEERNKSLLLLKKVLSELELNKKRILELGKMEEDSLILNTDVYGYILSNLLLDNGDKKIKGESIITKKNLLYSIEKPNVSNCKILTESDCILAFNPYSEESIRNYEYFPYHGKNLFLAMCGSNNDFDQYKKLKQLLEFKNKLKYNNINQEMIIFEDNNNYAGIVIGKKRKLFK